MQHYAASASETPNLPTARRGGQVWWARARGCHPRRRSQQQRPTTAATHCRLVSAATCAFCNTVCHLPARAETSTTLLPPKGLSVAPTAPEVRPLRLIASREPETSATSRWGGERSPAATVGCRVVSGCRSSGWAQGCTEDGSRRGRNRRGQPLVYHLVHQ